MARTMPARVKSNSATHSTVIIVVHSPEARGNGDAQDEREEKRPRGDGAPEQAQPPGGLASLVYNGEAERGAGRDSCRRARTEAKFHERHDDQGNRPSR